MNNLDFGSYCFIEQKRFGAKNELYLHKVIKQFKSNSYVDIPVQTPAIETLHKNIVPVISCICCGINETEVRKYRIADIQEIQSH